MDTTNVRVNVGDLGDDRAAVMGTLHAVSLLLGPNVTPADQAVLAARALVDQLLARLGCLERGAPKGPSAVTCPS